MSLDRKTEKLLNDVVEEASVKINKLAKEVLRASVDDFNDFTVSDYTAERRAAMVDDLHRRAQAEGFPVPRKAAQVCLDDVVDGWFRYRGRRETENRETENMREIIRQILVLYAEAEVDGENGRSYTIEQAKRLVVLTLDLERHAAEGSDLGEEGNAMVAEAIGQAREDREFLTPWIAEQEQQDRERLRTERIEAHKVDDVEMPTRRCSACGKKPARINDLCKKCARASGIIVHGKIGAS